MTKPLGMTLAAAGVICLAVAGCNSHPKAQAKASAAASALQANPAMQAAQAKAQACLAQQGPHLHALITCIAPAGSKAAVENCLSLTFAHDGLLVTKADRVKWEQTDAPNCIVAAGSTPSPAASSG
jgi:hypothetical protein